MHQVNVVVPEVVNVNMEVDMVSDMEMFSQMSGYNTSPSRTNTTKVTEECALLERMSVVLFGTKS
jgi:hypothetical protein